MAKLTSHRCCDFNVPVIVNTWIWEGSMGIPGDSDNGLIYLSSR